MATSMAERWELLANLGDKNPLDYGGYFVFRDRQGKWPDRAEYLDVPTGEPGDETYIVYRFDLDRCTFIKGILSDNPYHPDYPVWFARRDEEHKQRHGYDQWSNFTDLARDMGLTPEEFAADFCSPDPVIRARAYEEIAHHHGWIEFDQYPLTLSRQEAWERYAPFLPNLRKPEGGQITLERGPCGYLLTDERGRDVFIQTDWDFPGLASSFGWSISEVQRDTEEDMEEEELFGPAAPRCGHDGTDGTIDCPECGMRAGEFIAAAAEFLDNSIGETIDDPGYFSEEN